jgi:hypothetical protein
VGLSRAAFSGTKVIVGFSNDGVPSMVRKPTILPSISDTLNATTAMTTVGQTDDVTTEASGSALTTSISAVEDDILDAPYGAKVGSGRARRPGERPEARPQTYVSSVNRGAHFNIYLAAALLIGEDGQKLMRVSVRWQFKNGKPYAVRLRPAEQSGYKLREPPEQRPHFPIPTAAVGGLSRSLEAVPVESWREGDEICVRVDSFFADVERARDNGGRS